jgi:glycosyltransferase involved in cell wall biosynthesis
VTTIAVVIPCYKARESVCGVIARVGPEVARIYVVDDGCPQGTGAYVQETCGDPRVEVLSNPKNLGVGGAMARGYAAALGDGADVVVKIDADGQMDPALVPRLVYPIVTQQADYAKGNRFAAYARTLQRSRRDMPTVRWIGNSALSFLHKAASGYWNIADPTNGYTAIHRYALEGLDLERMARGFFFETDMLCQLNLLNAVVKDVPMPASYGTEQSNLRLRHVVRDFPALLLHRFLRRIAYKYFIYDFNVASLEFVFGVALMGFGTAFGLTRWVIGASHDQVNTAGTVMLSALPIILGAQLLLAAMSYDVANVPRTPMALDLADGDAILGDRSGARQRRTAKPSLATSGAPRATSPYLPDDTSEHKP